MKKVLKIVLLVVASALIVGVIGFIAWGLRQSPCTTLDRRCKQSVRAVTREDEPFFRVGTFKPQPGGKWGM